jgi:hypothetical protein
MLEAPLKDVDNDELLLDLALFKPTRGLQNILH